MNKIYGVRHIEQKTSIWTTLINRFVTFMATASWFLAYSSLSSSLPLANKFWSFSPNL
ncbi:hypothetical protein [Amylolactobacillus amylophilus]|uniref:hypothetical protein n=1 Tax=Amylolactobacillus amylophilus TaxID=1603 RepID=UPI00209308C4|nr:hypothetical protein [Amylolactobacillus amylophilus]